MKFHNKYKKYRAIKYALHYAKLKKYKNKLKAKISMITKT